MPTRRPSPPRYRAIVARGFGLAVGALLAVVMTMAPPFVAKGAAATPVADCVLPDDGSMGRIDYDTFRRPVGIVRAVMLFVDFPDVPATGSAERIFEDLSSPAASGWLARSSYEQLSLRIEPLQHWLRMPTPLSALKTVNGALLDDVAQGYAAQAIALADPEVDFSQVQIVYIVPNPEATAYPRSSEHDLAPEDGFVADGHVLRSVVTFGTAVYTRGYRTIAHETGHSFGLADYYNAFGRPTDRYAGAWSLMADSVAGADHFAWDKWRLGWLSDAQVRCVTAASTADYVLSPLETKGGIKAVILPDRAPDCGCRRVSDAPGPRRGDLLDRRAHLQGEQRTEGRRRSARCVGRASPLSRKREVRWRARRRRLPGGWPLDRLDVGAGHRCAVHREQRPHPRHSDEDLRGCRRSIRGRWRRSSFRVRRVE